LPLKVLCKFCGKKLGVDSQEKNTFITSKVSKTEKAIKVTK
jgi:hypothetical protein